MQDPYNTGQMWALTLGYDEYHSVHGYDDIEQMFGEFWCHGEDPADDPRGVELEETTPSEATYFTVGGFVFDEAGGFSSCDAASPRTYKRRYWKVVRPLTLRDAPIALAHELALWDDDPSPVKWGTPL